MKLFGKPGEAVFDGWTVVHIAWWTVIAGNCAGQKFPFWPVLLLCILGAFIWELMEIYLEKNTKLVAVHEGPWNRWVSDPIMAVVGTLLGYWII